MRGSGRDFDEIADGPMALAGARAKQVKVDFERKEFGVLLRGHDFAEHVQFGAGAIQMRRCRREHPVLQFRQDLLLLFGLLDFREPVEVRVAHQFRRQRAIRTQEKNGQFFQPFFALRRHNACPPVLGCEIFPRER